MILHLNFDVRRIPGQALEEGAKCYEISEITGPSFLAGFVIACSPSPSAPADNR
jgi:hypothetical protein